VSLVAIYLLVGVWLIGCSRPVDRRAEFVPAITGPEYASLPDLLTASDTVVVGRVTAVAPGRVLAGLQFRSVTVVVDEVLFGSVKTSTITVEEVGWLYEPGEGYFPVAPTHRPAPSSVGEVWLAFLHHKDEASRATGSEIYAHMGNEGFFLVEGERVSSTSPLLDPQGRQLASLSLGDLKAVIVETAAEIA
jgi:hypothetical protein